MLPLRVTQSCEAVYLDQTKPNTMYMDAIFILFLVPLFTKNGPKLTCCMIGGKFLISPCRKNVFFGFCAEILLFRAEILPCGPPLLPHSCAEPFLGVVQKYSFPGDIFTSATWSVYRYSHWPVFSFWRQLDVVVFEGWSRTRSARVAAAPARSLLSSASLHLSSPGRAMSTLLWSRTVRVRAAWAVSPTDGGSEEERRGWDYYTNFPSLAVFNI